MMGFFLTCSICGSRVRAMTRPVLELRAAVHYDRCINKRRRELAAAEAKAAQGSLLL